MLRNISTTLVSQYHHQYFLLSTLPTSGTLRIYGPKSSISLVSGFQLIWKAGQYDTEFMLQ